MAAFYIIANFDKNSARDEHRAFLTAHGVVGRVYIWDNGLNAQICGIVASIRAYLEYCEAACPGTEFLVKLDPTKTLVR